MQHPSTQHESMQHPSTQHESMQHASIAAASAGSPLSTTLSSARSLLGADVVLLFERSGPSTYRARHAFPAEIDATRCELPSVVADGTWTDVLVVHDVRAMGASSLAEATGCSSLLAAPLRGSGRHSILVALRKGRAGFGPADVERLDVLRNLVGQALDRTARIAHLGALTTRLTAAQELYDAVAAVDREIEVFEAVATRLHRVVPCDRATVAVLEPLSSSFRLISANRGQPGTEFALAGDATAGVLRATMSAEGAIRIDDLPNHLHGGARARVEELGLTCGMTVTMRVGDELIGSLQCGAREAGTYDETDLRLLETVAAQVSLQLQRLRNLARSQVRALRTEARLSLLTELEGEAVRASTRILRSSQEGFDEVVRDALGRIGDLVHADRAYVMCFDASGQQIEACIDWCATGVQSDAERWTNFEMSGLHWWNSLVGQGEAVSLTSLADIPAHAKAERELFVASDLKSLLCLPLLVGNRMIGFVGFDALRHQVRWDTSAHAMLKIVGDAIGTSLVRQRDEATLREREEWLRAIFEASNDAVFVMAMDGRFVDANESACDMLGYGRQELVQLSVFDVNPDVTPEMWAAKHEAPPVPEREVSARLQRSDGSRVDVEFTSRPMALGRRVYLHVTARDVSESLAAETERARLRAELTQAQKMQAVGTLAGGIAHNFNNLLGPIVAYVDLLSAESSDAQLEMLGSIRTAAQRAADLVQQILRLNRRADGPDVVVDVSGLVQEAVELLQTTLPSTVALTSSIDTDVGGVTGDAAEIHQIVLNLATNAFHAMEGMAGGRIHVSLRRTHLDAPLAHLQPGAYVELSVADTGVGMSEDVRVRVFEPYFTTKAPGRGTGLGLTTVFAVVQDLGGTIEVESAEGQGTTFRVLMPASSVAPSSHPEVEPVYVGPNERLRVLVIDDEDMNARLYVRMLDALGYDAEAFTDANEALERFRATPAVYDLVMTDLTMPAMDGIEVARHIHATRSGLPVVLCTGFSDDQTEQHALEQGIRSVLRKPFVLRTLDQAVDLALGGTPAQ